ncbi:MAG: HD domain-containing protein [Clostridiales bacterium]|nr:HD domain-containing protein [Clostridiales bacterium]
MEKLNVKRANRLMLMLYSEWKEHDNIDRPLKIEWNVMHMFTSSQLAKLYALKNDLDPELCAMIAILHDIAVVEGKFRKEHDELAGKYVLGAIKRYNDGGRYKLEPILPEETEIIISAVTVHGFKDVYTDNSYVEMLKNIDSLDAYLHGVRTEGSREERVEKILTDLGI